MHGIHLSGFDFHEPSSGGSEMLGVVEAESFLLNRMYGPSFQFRRTATPFNRISSKILILVSARMKASSLSADVGSNLTRC